MFMFYYVKVFLNVFHINEYWFNVSQVLFMIWNAVNDPLFGYIQDVGGWCLQVDSKICLRVANFGSNVDSNVEFQHF